MTDVQESVERVKAYLAAREAARGLDPEELNAYNGAPLLVSDLRALADFADTVAEAERGDDVESVTPDTVLRLTPYERDNLRAALLAISGFCGASPLGVLNTGDWLMQVGYKIDPMGENGVEGRPNHTAAALVEMANFRYVPRPRPLT